jgi:hypothetical protein
MARSKDGSTGRCTRDLKKGRGNKMTTRGVKVFSRGRKNRENFDKIFCKLLYAEVGEKECTPLSPIREHEK